MADGIHLDEQVVLDFKKLATRKINYLSCRLSDDCTQIVVDRSGKVDGYDEFVEVLPEDEPRYAIHDFEYATADGRRTSKIVLFSWLPESSPIKSKMIFASSKATLRAALDGIAAEIQTTDYSDLDVDEVTTRLVR
ncbi:actin-binding ADF family protein [Streptomyces sp. NPDC058411]|uniref:actin-binding ADF family protein n=1 Tax=Streptomyces sp. NPDC058411 TaxID=3346485 RepID=UPI0036637A16